MLGLGTLRLRVRNRNPRARLTLTLALTLTRRVAEGDATLRSLVAMPMPNVLLLG